MGHLKEKYTKEYFLGSKTKDGNLDYGAIKAVNENGELILREHDTHILSKIDFNDRRVLEFGFGRGEAAKYAIENGACYYLGVDFSDTALELAKKLNINSNVNPVFECDDGLNFVKKLRNKITQDNHELFDVVIMFDFVEHVPRSELSEIFADLKHCVSEKSVLIINTPAYKHDNDVMKEGLDEKNFIDCYDTSNLIEETKGMHCNLYTTVSLAQYMNKCGFLNITQHHYFAKDGTSSILRQSYAQNWENCQKQGYPLLGDYEEDRIEYPYPVGGFEEIQFKTGTLKGITIKATKDLFSFFAYPYGEYDSELFYDFLKTREKRHVIFDVGGWIGITAMIFAKLSADDVKIVTFEPNPYNFSRLCDNLALNRSLDKKIQLSNLALSSSNGFVNMFLSSNVEAGHSSTSRLENTRAKISDNNLPDGFFNLNIETKTLDDFVKETGLIPDVIKVDIEGAEHLFLLGALETIEKYKPVFYIEFHSEYCAMQCTSMLVKQGYEMTCLKHEADNRIFIKAIFSEENEMKTMSSKNIHQEIKLDTLMFKLDEQARLINMQSEKLDVHAQLFETQSQKLESQSQKLDTQSQKLDAQSQKLDAHSSTLNEQRINFSNELHTQRQMLEDIRYRVKTSPLQRLFRKIKAKIRNKKD